MVRGILIFLLLLFLVVILVGVVLLGGLALALPRLEELEPKTSALTSMVYDINGQLITTFHAEQNRVLISSDQIPDSMKKAIVAIEDERFYEHRGIDLIGIARAFISNLTKGEIVEGGSTITQQYVKNAYLTSEKTLTRKIKEAFLAYQLERRYSKDKILEMYLNTIYFGQGAYGIQVAAQTYFGVDAKDLTLEQAALLAALPRAPTEFNPFTNPEKAKARRNVVLDKMYEQGYISEEELERAKDAPVTLNPRTTNEAGLAPYFVEYIKQQLIQKYGYNQVFEGGMKIYTTLDLKIQQAAERAITEVLGNVEPEGALVAIDPKTGYIKAMVGGRDFSKNKYNLASQARRQPGSTFKPFVLVAAIDKGIPPSRTYKANGPIVIKQPPGPDWKVDNFGGEKFAERLTLIDATVHSVNVVYAQLIMDVGPDQVVQIAHKMGITSELEPLPAIALGGLEIGVSPLEMTSAFATLANRGVYHPPVAILKVTDMKGNIKYEYRGKGEQVIDGATASLATEILKQVIARGTGRGANIGRPAAGKTGTTQKFTDAWFVGYTPDLAAGVWMGYPAENKSMGPINGRIVVGGTFPADIWRLFMTEALKDIPPSEFPEPERGLVEVKVCSDSGLLPGPFCPPDHIQPMLFVEGSEPTEYCNIHDRISMPDVTGMKESEALSLLEQLNLNVDTSEEFDDSVEPDIVIDQDPAPGSELVAIDGKAPTVSIVVSKGPDPIRSVPDVVGMSEGDAINTLKSNRFEHINVDYAFSDTVPEGIVIEQRPPAGSEANISDQIILVVSKGQETVPVPDVLGKSEEEAMAVIQTAGLVPNVIHQPDPAQTNTGVYLQDPPGGTTVPPGSTVTLTVNHEHAPPPPEPPTTEEPTTEQPTTEEPTTEQPPTTEEPPTTEQPSAEEPTT